MCFGRTTAFALALYFELGNACLSDIGSLLALFPTPAPQMAAIRNDLCSGANDSFLISKYNRVKLSRYMFATDAATETETDRFPNHCFQVRNAKWFLLRHPEEI